jgi:hypothetical protein
MNHSTSSPCFQRENSGLAEMMMGGGTYIVGLVAFKCDGRVPFAHAIWHCFVFVGAGFHYSAVCKYLLGQQALGAGPGFMQSTWRRLSTTRCSEAVMEDGAEENHRVG